MNIESYGLFLAASFLLWITPGQDTLYIIARSVAQGRMAGVVSVLGISTGALFHAGLAIAGVSLIILTSPVLFLMIKIVGGLYLIYLGVSTLMSESSLPTSTNLETTKLRKIYSQGVITNVLNPKVALFFIAFLPQFADVNSVSASLLFLAFTFVLGGTIWCLLVACFASSFSTTIRNSNLAQHWINRVTGGVYIALGLNVLRAKA
ncbi:LysE family translocator [Arenicella sp. 4NH20-0111]|uniref:LysE family translocator n=1 Tax=Arenicella sp. 4NH20-0111 TaxID=3127648 RepID=UPI00310A3818